MPDAFEALADEHRRSILGMLGPDGMVWGGAARRFALYAENTVPESDRDGP